MTITFDASDMEWARCLACRALHLEGLETVGPVSTGNHYRCFAHATVPDYYWADCDSKCPDCRAGDKLASYMRQIMRARPICPACGVLGDSRFEFLGKIELPARWEICGRCDGDGKHDHEAFSNGITAQEWAEDWDDDDRETYVSGGYSVSCSECHGSGKVRVVDIDHCSPEEVRMSEAIDRAAQDDADYDAECRAERRMGA